MSNSRTAETSMRLLAEQADRLRTNGLFTDAPLPAQCAIDSDGIRKTPALLARE